MSANSTRVLSATLAQIDEELTTAQQLALSSQRRLNEIMALLVGKRISYGGSVHEIVAARIVHNSIQLTGVRVSRGRVGTRQFYAGDVSPKELLRNLNR